MQKEDGRKERLPGRILARVLAEDLRNVRGGGSGLTSEVTDPNPRRDITNGTSDNDGPPPE